MPASLVACFDGGNFILGGLTLNEPRYVDFGLTLVNGCRDTYVQTATGIGPEVFQWQDNKHFHTNTTDNSGPPAEQAAFYERAGSCITGSSYVLRPEVIESYYYAYRATGNPIYQEWAWEAFVAINKTCSVGSGFSSINDVNAPDGGGFSNFQESFWFAEVLKYSYLIHAEVSLIFVLFPPYFPPTMPLLCCRASFFLCVTGTRLTRDSGRSFPGQGGPLEHVCVQYGGTPRQDSWRPYLMAG